MRDLSPAGAAERRAEFYRLRLDGLSMWQAATALGLADGNTIRRYERWFRAEHPDAVSPEPPARRSSRSRTAGTPS